MGKKRRPDQINDILLSTDLCIWIFEKENQLATANYPRFKFSNIQIHKPMYCHKQLKKVCPAHPVF